MPSSVGTGRARQPENHAIIDSSQSRMCARASQITSWPCRVCSLIADGVAHGAGGHEQRRFLAGDLGRRAAPAGSRWDLRRKRRRRPRPPPWRAASRRSAGSRYRCADRSCDSSVMNSAKTSFESRTPRRVRRSTLPVGLRAVPAPTKRLDRAREAPPAPPAPAAFRPSAAGRRRTAPQRDRAGAPAARAFARHASHTPRDFEILPAPSRRRRSARPRRSRAYGSSRQYFKLWRDSKPGRAKFEIS